VVGGATESVLGTKVVSDDESDPLSARTDAADVPSMRAPVTAHAVTRDINFI
jgi:hypothetical protein